MAKMSSRWHSGDHARDSDGLSRFWIADTPSGRYEIWQGRRRSLGGKSFAYELLRPNGTRQRYEKIADAKKEVNDLLL